MEPSAYPKPEKGTAQREKRRRHHVRMSLDVVESNQVRARSGGQCEVRWLGATGQGESRCLHLATQVHHMIGGHGRRARGISMFAEHKQAVCDPCHLGITGDIGGKKLVRIGGVVPHWTDSYRRVK